MNLEVLICKVEEYLNKKVLIEKRITENKFKENTENCTKGRDSNGKEQRKTK